MKIAVLEYVLIDPRSYGPMFFMNCNRAVRFVDSDEKDPRTGKAKRTPVPATNREDVPLWTIEVTMNVQKWGKTQAGTFSFTVASPSDPAENIAPGSPIEPVNLTQSLRELTFKDDGKAVGGRPSYYAEGLRPPTATRAKGDA